MPKAQNQIAVSSYGLKTGNVTYDSLLKSFNRPFTFENVLAFMNEAERNGKSASTLSLMKVAFKKAVLSQTKTMRGQVAVIEAFKRIKTPRQDRKVYHEEIPTAFDLERVKSVATPRIAAMIDFLAQTGLRISEALNIRLVDLETKGPHTFIEIRGKGKKDRRIFYPNAEIAQIRKTFNSTEFLFERKGGGKISRVYFHRAIQDAGNKAGIAGLHPHSMRHRFATFQIVEKKKDVAAVSQYLGHASAAVTLDMYVHSQLSPEDIFENPAA